MWVPGSLVPGASSPCASSKRWTATSCSARVRAQGSEHLEQLYRAEGQLHARSAATFCLQVRGEEEEDAVSAARGQADVAGDGVRRAAQRPLGALGQVLKQCRAVERALSTFYIQAACGSLIVSRN